MNDPLILFLLGVVLVAILVALFRPTLDEPLVVSSPKPLDAETVAAIRDHLRQRRTNDPIVVSDGLTVSRVRS